MARLLDRMNPVSALTSRVFGGLNAASGRAVGRASVARWISKSSADPSHRDDGGRAGGAAAPLNRRYGRGRWRKRKGVAAVRLLDGSIHTAEVHWYEAHGIGRREMKIKFPLLD